MKPNNHKNQIQLYTINSQDIYTLNNNTNNYNQVQGICSYCRKSQEQCQADILHDDSRCKLTLCARCFKIHQNDSCATCSKKIKEHLSKLKNPYIKEYLDNGKNFYEKQFRIRSECTKIQSIDDEMINLLAYFHKIDRNKYNTYKREVQKIQEQINRKNKIFYGDFQKKNLPELKQIHTSAQYDGRQACGWTNQYSKGLKQLFASFNKG